MDYVKDGTLTIQARTIKEVNSIDRVVVYADGCEREYLMPLPEEQKEGENKMITLQGFLNMIIGPSFTWVHVMDPLTYKELSRGYVDDLLKEHTQFIQKFEVVSFYTVREVLYINVRRIKER